MIIVDYFHHSYPDKWFHDITRNSKFFSMAAVITTEVVGIIVADIKRQSKCNREDSGLVSKRFNLDPSVAYILTLGVVKEKRRNGIASLLLQCLVDHLNEPKNINCKAIFLHVLSSNVGAIEFYEKQNFKLHKVLPFYYLINGKCKDGLTYVKYINNGRPPWTFYSFISTLSCCLKQFATSIFDLILMVTYFIHRKYSNFITNALPYISRFSARMARLILKRNQRNQRYQHLTSA